MEFSFISCVLQDDPTDRDIDQILQSLRDCEVANEVSDLSIILTQVNEHFRKMKKYKVTS